MRTWLPGRWQVEAASRPPHPLSAFSASHRAIVHQSTSPFTAMGAFSLSGPHCSHPKAFNVHLKAFSTPSPLLGRCRFRTPFKVPRQRRSNPSVCLQAQQQKSSVAFTDDLLGQSYTCVAYFARPLMFYLQLKTPAIAVHR